ncbi:MAG: hypothetical protein ACXVW2_17800 [Nocardioidaceae bacterium]
MIRRSRTAPSPSARSASWYASALARPGWPCRRLARLDDPAASGPD